MSRAIELAGFALFVIAAATLWGAGVAEFVAGAELVLIAQWVEGDNVGRQVMARLRRLAARIARDPAAPGPLEEPKRDGDGADYRGIVGLGAPTQ